MEFHLQLCNKIATQVSMLYKKEQNNRHSENTIYIFRVSIVLFLLKLLNGNCNLLLNYSNSKLFKKNK